MKLLTVAAALAIGVSYSVGSAAQDKKSDAKKTEDRKTEALLRVLESTMNVKDFQNPMTFKEFLGVLADKLAATKKVVPIRVDLKAFAEKKINAERIYSASISPQYPVKEMPLGLLLQLAVNQLPGEACWVAKAGEVVITTKKAGGKK